MSFKQAEKNHMKYYLQLSDQREKPLDSPKQFDALNQQEIDLEY